MSIQSYRQNYPRPQFVRSAWSNLNGEWDFRFDDGNVGESEHWYDSYETELRIRVPFVYETKASGIGDSKFHPYVWYQRSFTVPAEAVSKRIMLNFQAVDYVAKVWVNGNFVGNHKGGYTAFSFDITSKVRKDDGENRIVVKVEDSNDVTQPRGKQRWRTDNFGCWYVQTTGIWQTVWLEYVDERHLQSVKITPDLDTNSVRFDYHMSDEAVDESHLLTTKITMDGRLIKQASIVVDRSQLTAGVELISDSREWRVETWSPEHPKLYEVEFVLTNSANSVLDKVQSYFGLRKVSIQKGKVLLNNAPIYQRLILDQGYWTDSHLTPPSEEAIIEDIDKIMAMGYNGVRKHQKIEDPRFLYWCDVKGLLVWSEMAATYEFNDRAVNRFTKEWLDIVQQQYNHPCIITWVPFNESWGIGNVFVDRRQQQFTEAIYHLTKSIDPNRPVIVNDGWEHTVSDIVTLHDYEESGERFRKRYANKDAITSNEISHMNWKYAIAQGYEYRGQPIIISEFGGIAFKSEEGWGYGNQVDSEEAFLDRFERITQAIKDMDYICGYCYTQVTDVQQEVNGLLTEDRQPKIPLEKIKAINLA
ncbi:beta galactosidase jelly roll domain-containing protein [Paenibacillus sp. KQZ6P-2]|uniref:Beta galactosidase jelly roll domain-containing protein n=1 Tax=Paenibacillus mangrovi TaxID=2931978 RepID=A0A9X2B4N4_9BACL|nr:sugar-binding domain-containing protein [Paenibacillus mangrovi]MCJ8014160.1 beta galactosidase jelly roll domain-containing protein [Paenibacillus mangrovi]